jgi:transcriptional regulator with XRE-family HTH domain
MGREVDKKAFGGRAKRRREAIGVSQGDIGIAIGMSQQGVDNIEAGKVARPRLLPELAESLQTTIKWLLYEEGPEVVSPPDQADEIDSLLQTVAEDQRGIVIRLLKTLSERKTDVA